MARELFYKQARERANTFLALQYGKLNDDFSYENEYPFQKCHV
jgi:hypothetical protein